MHRELTHLLFVSTLAATCLTTLPRVEAQPAQEGAGAASPEAPADGNATALSNTPDENQTLGDINLTISGDVNLTTTETSDQNASATGSEPMEESATLAEPPKSDNGDEYVDPGDPFGATKDRLGFSNISFRILFQTRYLKTFADQSSNERISYRIREENLAEDDDGYSVNRFFLRIAANPSQYVGFKAILDFAELIPGNPDNVVKQAYATVRAIPERLELQVGVFKLPFSTLELDPSAQYEFTDFGPSNSLVKDLGFAGRDIGLQLMVAPLRKKKRLRLSAGIFRAHAKDEHDSLIGAVGVRAESKPIKGLRIGADLVAHPYTVRYNRPFETSSKDVVLNPEDPNYPRAQRWDRGKAISADIRYDRKRLMVRGEVLYGDRVDYYERYGARTFEAAWGLIAYRFKVGSTQLMPAVRAEWLDSDREHNTGVRRELSFAFTTMFFDYLRFVVDVTRSDVQAQSPLLDQPKPLSDPPYLELDHTRVTGQLQVEL